jgi:CheY-like chemotaxis protein
MTTPLALVFTEHLVSSNELTRRLEGLGYRVQTVTGSENLVSQVQEAKPLVLIAELGRRHEQVCAAISRIRSDQSTSHIPVLALVAGIDEPLEKAARAAGAALVASNSAIVGQLPQLLEHVLQVE